MPNNIKYEFPHKIRLRRLRQHPRLRELVRETQVNISDLIQPLFIKEGLKQKQAIASMPGLYQLTLGDVVAEATQIYQLGIPAVMLFGIPLHKDDVGSASYQENGIIQQAIRLIKAAVPELLVMSDLCFCEYMDHGHCGVMNLQRNDVDNDRTLELLGKQAVSHAMAGVDVIVPSGMMDGKVAATRYALDKHQFQHIPILSHTAKYSSSFYGPFREAAEGAPQFGDRSSYQMDIANGQEALREAELDLAEGADILMVKPASIYLDVICRIKEKYPHIPVSAYHVSGEYAMLKAAAAQGWLNERKVVHETLTAIKRAGADMIVTYYAKEFAQWQTS